MKIFFTLLLSLIVVYSYADRIYIVNSPGYNTAEPILRAAIAVNGHTIVVDSTNLTTLPAGFTSTCVDPVNGFDWLCFFGTNNFVPMLPQIQAFIDAGGKVFYQYEVSCCTSASLACANVLAGLTGRNIVENIEPYIAIGSAATGGWEANLNCCATFVGNAYKGLDNIPVHNQLQATATIAGAAPPISTCLNFGFFFTTTDFVGTAHQGGITGLGDVNIWYHGGEPHTNGGTNPIDTNVVNYFFPRNTATSCYLFPPGCMQTFTQSPQAFNLDLGNDTVICTGDSLVLNAASSNATYSWQNGSIDSTFIVTSSGTYWVVVTKGACSVTDTVNVITSTCNFPNANFTCSQTNLCNNTCINFTDNSTLNPVSWNWSFPGGSPPTSNQQNPANICYNQSGNFNVTLVACNGSGCDTVIMNNFITVFPDLQFSAIVQHGDTLFSVPGLSNYQWYFGSSLIQNANSYFYVAPQNGTYGVQVTDSNGCTAFATILDVVTGIENIIDPETFNCYFNSGIISIDIKSTDSYSAFFSLRDVLGQEIFSRSFFINTGFNHLDLSTLPMADGIYFLSLRNGSNSVIKKILVKH
jgi:PKD repeat protein